MTLSLRESMSKSTSDERKKGTVVSKRFFFSFVFFSLALFVLVLLVCLWGDYLKRE